MDEWMEFDYPALDGKPMSDEDFLALPETNRHVELVDGYVVCPPTPTSWHQEAVMKLMVALHQWAEARAGHADVLHGPLDIVFGPGRVLQPDLMVWTPPLARPVPQPVTRVPELCIEVVSERVAYDRTLKRVLYAAGGVQEFWAVFPERAVVEQWSGPRLERRENIEGLLASALLPGFQLDVRCLRVE